MLEVIGDVSKTVHPVTKTSFAHNMVKLAQVLISRKLALATMFLRVPSSKTSLPAHLASMITIASQILGKSAQVVALSAQQAQPVLPAQVHLNTF